MTPLNERVREYMEANNYEDWEQTNDYVTLWRSPTNPDMTGKQAQFMYLASLQAQKDELEKLRTDDIKMFGIKTYEYAGHRIAELDKLMETDLQPKDQ